MASDATLYEAQFHITSVLDQTYERVARIIGSNQENDTSITLDINSELYPLERGDSILFTIATSLNVDGTKDERGWREVETEGSIAAMYDYVCYGKVYKHHDPGDGANIKVYVSFGGLLLMLDGPYKKLSPLRQDYIYMLLKKS